MQRLLSGLAVTACAATLLVAPSVAASAATDHTAYTGWSSSRQLASGRSSGVVVTRDSVRLGTPNAALTAQGRRWSYGSWTSPWRSTGFRATRLVPSWTADTPRGSWIQVLVRVRRDGRTGSWDTVADWAHLTDSIRRTSAGSQTDDLTRVDTDTVSANGTGHFTSYQLRVRLLHRPGTTAAPVVRSIGAVASSYARRSIRTSRTTMTRDVVLRVPSFSQMRHAGNFPQYGGGGEAWCSPTSTTMVLRYFHSGPTRAAASWAGPVDPWVAHAARHTYDHAYGGTGNWPFNTAYAGAYGNDAFVTRLQDLTDAERFVRAGIPVVVSVAFGRGQLTGAPISSTPGHLLVVVGFTRTGRVVVNDPAAHTNATVRRSYDRAQLERAWLGGSGGIAYVIRPTSRKLPADTVRW